MPALDVIKELKLRAEIMKMVDQRDICAMDNVCDFFREYNNDADSALKRFDLTREQLMKNIKV